MIPTILQSSGETPKMGFLYLVLEYLTEHSELFVAQIDLNFYDGLS